MTRKSTHKITRKSKPEVRWDASTGGMVPEVHFDDYTRQEIQKLCAAPATIEQLENYTGLFLLQQNLEDRAPTAGDYAKTLEDLERAASGFIERLGKLRGHELQGVLDSAWYAHTKALPDWRPLQGGAMEFRRNIWLAQHSLPEFIKTKGRRESTAAIRDFMRNCLEVLEAGGQQVSRSQAGNLISLAELCLKSAGIDRYTDSLHHYIPKKVAKN